MKHLLFSLKMRERVMAFVALAVGAFLWSTGAWARTRGGWDNWQALEAEAKIQSSWMAKEKEIRDAATAAVQGLDAGHGFDEAHLVAEAVAAAKEAGLTANTEAPKTQKAGRFAVHSLQMSCRRADMASVVKFYENISERAPYVAISQLTLQSERGTTGTVTATLRLDALELISPPTPAPAK
ncbi:MAG: hypothetical protein D4R66_07505 [Opitutales bacterium]|nr:MAG: hypothetical protein D4R66_07505 [Opitutales bacterium]